MLAWLGLVLSRVFRAVVPDPFVIAVALTVVTAAAALVLGDFPAVAGADRPDSLASKAMVLLDAWRGPDGIWKFLAFSMQMCLVLVTGHALAEAPVVRRLLTRAASIPASTASASALVSVVATLTGIVNWGLALIVGAILAREVGRSLAARGIRAHYPLIVASGYTGLMVWHGGLSGSAPLSMTTAVGASRVLPASVAAGLEGSGVPLTQTVFSPLNLVVTGGLLVIIPAVMALAAPRRSADIQPIPPTRHDGHDHAESVRHAQFEVPVGHAASPAERLERSPLVAWLVASLVVAATWRFASTGSIFSAGLDEINAAMLAAGLAIHGSVRSYLSAAESGVRGCTGIVLQFPLYGGIMAMGVSSGLIGLFARGMTDTLGGRSIPVVTYWSAAVVNLFIPSGGGQWGVQGPIAIETAARAEVPIGVMVMAVAYGDQTTNMLQPFWALPLLAITGARARDIVAYTCLPMAFGLCWISLVLAVMA